MAAKEHKEHKEEKLEFHASLLMSEGNSSAKECNKPKKTTALTTESLCGLCVLLWRKS